MLPSFLKPKFLFLAIGAVVIAVIIGFLQLRLSQKQGSLSQTARDFSDLVIRPTFARGNFEVLPTRGDSLGVETETSFVITSKEEVEFETLKASISLLPETQFTIQKVDEKKFRVDPATPLEGRKVYNLKIATATKNNGGELVSNDYSWAFQVKDQFKVLHTLPRDQGTHVPVDTGIEITFSHDNFKNIQSHFSITPNVEGRFEVHKRTLVFIPKALRDYTLYTVSIDKNVELEGSAESLEEDYVFQFETQSKDKNTYYSYFGFAQDYYEFSPTNEPALEIYNNRDQTSYAVEVYAFKSEEQFVSTITAFDEIPYWARRARNNEILDISSYAQVATHTLSPQEYGYKKYLVLPEALPGSLYLARVVVDGRISQAFIQVSNLVVYSNVTVTDSLVWVNDVRTKVAVQGAEVSIVNEDVNVKTDSDGIAVFNNTSILGSDNGKQRIFVRVQYKNEITFIPLTIYSYSRFKNYNKKDDYWVYFYTDRKLYRPNDEVNFWGFIKHRDGLPVRDAFEVVFGNTGYFNYYFEDIHYGNVSVQVGKDGTFTGFLPVKNVSPGFYNIQLRLGEENFINEYVEVEDFSKPEYKIGVVASKDALFEDDEVTFDILATYFEGTPVPKLDLSYSMGKQEGQLVSDEHGETSITLRGQNRWNSLSTTENVRVWPTNAEKGDIRGSKYVRVFKSHFAPKSSFKRHDDGSARLEITLNHVIPKNYPDFKGDPSTDVPVHVVISSTEYTKKETGEYYDFINKKVRKTYTYDSIKKVVDTADFVTDHDGNISYSLPLDTSKNYTATITFPIDYGSDKTFETKQYLYNTHLGGSHLDNYTLVLKEENDFAVDEVVDIIFTKDNEDLPSGRRRNFLYYHLQRGLGEHVVSDSSRYRFTFDKEYIPNVYIQGVWFDGSGYRSARNYSFLSRGSGLNVRYDKKNSELDITVAPDQESYKPGQKVKLDVIVKDANGNSVVADLNLSLVDEALFSLRENTDEILSKLYSDVSSGELATYSSHKAPLLAEQAEGGGCFLAGTRVLMADGTEKNIEDVSRGDFVKTFKNEYGREFVEAKVLETFKHTVAEYWVVNDHLKITPEHRVFINTGWMMIGEAKVSDALMDEHGDVVIIESIKQVKKPVVVYNLFIETYHTYIANGIYVHNDKGGVREEFVDTALFTTARTNNNGTAVVEFTLPDNLTSWRIIAQAVTKDLLAGTKTENINVSLPFFVETTYADDYIIGDVPHITMRSFGAALSSGDAVQYVLDAPSLGVTQKVVEGFAFKPSYIEIPNLSIGEHKIISKAQVSGHDDTVIGPIRVGRSRFRIGKQDFYEVKPGTQISANADSRVHLTLSDHNQGRLYHDTVSLSWSGGDRVDQKLARVLGWDLRQQYFKDKRWNQEELNVSAYQTPKDGIALLPYGSAEFELTAKIAALNTEYFDNISLANYFYTIVNDSDSNQEEVGIALYGLSGLGEPVLNAVKSYALVLDLTPREKLFTGLAALELGEKSLARDVYEEVMESFGDVKDPYTRILAGKDQDDYVQHTVLAALLAAGLNDENHVGLWKYVEDHYTKDILIKLEKLQYVSNVLPTLLPGAVRFELIVGDKKIIESLEKGKTFEMSLTREELEQLRFQKVNGKLGLVSEYEQAVNARNISVSPLVSVSREYRVDRQTVDVVKQDDLVEVRIRYDISQSSIGGRYQITDLLPSGLTLVTRPYRRGAKQDCVVYYPHDVNNQQIKFNVGKENSRQCGDSISYFARVVSPGTYVAEPATIQSMRSNEIKNISDSSSITIVP